MQNRFSRKRKIGLLLVGIGLVGLTVSTQEWLNTHAEKQAASTQEGSAPRESCYVLSVYDGDTLACDLNGNRKVDAPEEQIRLLGIDTPERHYSKKNKTGKDMFMSVESSQWTESRTFHKTIYLESDLQQNDRYGRRLAYVYLSANAAQSLNEDLLRQGLAKVLFIPPNKKYIQTFYRAQKQAKQNQLGLWRRSRTQ